MNDPVEMLIDQMRSYSLFDTINEELVDILHIAAYIPIPKCGFNSHTKPFRYADVKRAHNKSMSRCWVLEGRPRGMQFVYYRMYTRAKSESRHELLVAYEHYMQRCYDDLNETAECDVRLFWKQIKRFKVCSSKVYLEIVYGDKMCSTPESLANCFADYFHDLQQPKDNDNFDNEFKYSIESTYNDIIKPCGVEGEYLPGGLITEQEVSTLIG
ncbi:unnamed protein product [Mytilus coruscus]|uniref:Uncharacterized protein n=1 Tax=Mytilus coruscus TaxID=42192 RepID=A0A6J8BMM9_MYTCO|nr:unnamed protein product [Mytilus coruscus]